MKRELLPLAMIIATFVSGCHWSNRRAADRDQHYIQLSTANNQQQAIQTNRAMPPQVVPSSDGIAAHSGSLASRIRQPRDIELYEAIEIALEHSQIARVSRGGAVSASGTTFYDIQASKQRLAFALAAFDSSFESELYTNQFESPPDAFFGPGLLQPEQRDEAAFTAGLTKPLLRGGKLSANYNPDPGYFFEPGTTTAGFNPRYISEVEVSLTQPLLRGAGADVNMAPIQVAQLTAEQTAWQFKASLMESVRSVIEAYWDLSAAQVAAEEYKEVIPLLEEIVRIQEESLKAKLVIASDVAKARAKLYEYRQEYIRLQSRLLSRELQLRNLLNLPPDDGTQLVTRTEPTDQNVNFDGVLFYLQAVDHRPDIVQQRLNVSIRRLELLVANNQRKPDLDFTALYRLNGLGKDLGDALDQMADAEFTDVEIGFTMSMPVGLRQAKAAANEARFRLARETKLLQQQVFTVSHELSEVLKDIDFAYQEYEQARLQLESADQWVEGAQLRYESPAPESGGSNWKLQYLDDYFDAIRFRTDASIEVAATLTAYNSLIVRAEEIKGTLLNFFGVDYIADPCRQSSCLPKLQQSIAGGSMYEALWGDQSNVGLPQTTTLPLATLPEAPPALSPSAKTKTDQPQHPTRLPLTTKPSPAETSPTALPPPQPKNVLPHAVPPAAKPPEVKPNPPKRRVISTPAINPTPVSDIPKVQTNAFADLTLPQTPIVTIPLGEPDARARIATSPAQRGRSDAVADGRGPSAPRETYRVSKANYPLPGLRARPLRKGEVASVMQNNVSKGDQPTSTRVNKKRPSYSATPYPKGEVVSALQNNISKADRPTRPSYSATPYPTLPLGILRATNADNASKPTSYSETAYPELPYGPAQFRQAK